MSRTIGVEEEEGRLNRETSYMFNNTWGGKGTPVRCARWRRCIGYENVGLVTVRQRGSRGPILRFSDLAGSSDLALAAAIWAVRDPWRHWCSRSCLPVDSNIQQTAAGTEAHSEVFYPPGSSQDSHDGLVQISCTERRQVRWTAKKLDGVLDGSCIVSTPPHSEGLPDYGYAFDIHR